jgi:hypothetical protein
MTCVLKSALTTKPRVAAVIAAVATLGLTGCDDTGGDPRRQVGANPVLPALQQYLVPPIQIARPEPWGDDKPKVPDGFKAQALATGFEHPRSLYVLPNGDILVIESNGPKAPVFRPKDIITGWVQWYAGAKAPDANRITLLRDTNGDGVPEVRTVFLDHLNSPFGVALVDHDLYVANTDAIVRYPYDDGQTTITTPGTKLTDLPGGPIDHHCRWWPVRTAPSSMSGSARTATSQKTESRRNTSGPRYGRSTARPVHIGSMRAVYATPQDCSGSMRPAGSGRSPTSATRSGLILFRTI